MGFGSWGWTGEKGSKLKPWVLVGNPGYFLNPTFFAVLEGQGIYIYVCMCVCHYHLQRFSGSAFNVQTETLRTEKVDLLSPDRAVEVTEVAQAKKEAKLEECGTKQQEDSESIFSAALLPVSFYSDLIKGHSCRAVILALRSMFFHVLSPLQL